jgi:hypothetical protein
LVRLNRSRFINVPRQIVRELACVGCDEVVRFGAFRSNEEQNWCSLLPLRSPTVEGTENGNEMGEKERGVGSEKGGEQLAQRRLSH